MGQDGPFFGPSGNCTRAALIDHADTPRVVSLTLTFCHACPVKAGLWVTTFETHFEAHGPCRDRYFGGVGQQRKLLGTSPAQRRPSTSIAKRKAGTLP